MNQALYIRASNAHATATRALEQLADARVEAAANDALACERFIAGAKARLRLALQQLEGTPSRALPLSPTRPADVRS
jgi:hypothetical protein